MSWMTINADSWLFKMLNISGWGARSPKQDICITHSKFQETQWKKRQKNQERELQKIQRRTMNFLEGSTQSFQLWFHSYSGKLHWACTRLCLSLSIVRWELGRSSRHCTSPFYGLCGKETVIFFSAVPTGRLTSIQWIVPTNDKFIESQNKTKMWKGLERSRGWQR